MFLKSIEIRGFKSFADKTELEFKGGVTAVVGPNGSGKSNISDAVRWVLGEQSVKSLRGGKMEDVIFAGTQFRKPVGLAQVSLVLDNSDYELPVDYSDVTISRRLYRSGESEYYINNNQCRLKDIHELFMDTGIGKEGYSIIGQGKIEAILSGRPEERRSLLEEAAGIVKFKSRKEEAEKRLENTEQNLVRINDILSTFEERIEPLRIEREKAKEFLKLSELLKESEITAILYLVEGVEAKIQGVNNAFIKIEKELRELIEEKNINKANLNGFNQELSNHEKKYEEDKNQYFDLKNKYSTSKSKINLLQERIDNYQDYIKKATEELEILKNKKNILNNNKIAAENEVSSHQEKQKTINKEIVNLENEMASVSKELQVLENKLNQYRQEAFEYLTKISEEKNNSNTIRSNLDAIKRKVEQLVLACEGYNNSIKVSSSTISVMSEEVLTINNLIKASEEDVKLIKKQVSKYNNELQLQEQKLKGKNINLNKLEANYNLLINLEKQYEGYTKAVKNLMQHIDDGKIRAAKTNCFVLGDIIKVDSKLETAIEIALGGAISDIITKNEKIAKELINYLKKNNLGRATFLPLNILSYKNISINEKISNIQGYIGIASDLIEYEPMFSPAIKYVLGRTLIADNMENALVIAKATNYSYKIVTLEGEIINPGGSLTGGSIYSKSTNIIGRKREIEELHKKILEEQKYIENITSEINTLKENIKKADNDLLNLRDNIHYKQIDVTRLEEKIKSLVEESTRIKKNLDTSEKEIQISNKNIETLELDLQNKEALIQNLISMEKDNEKALEECELKIKQNKNVYDNIKSKHMELKISKAKVDEIVLNKIKDLERISKELDEIDVKNKNFDDDIIRYKKELETNRLEIENTLSSLTEMEALIAKLEVQFQDNDIKKISIKEKISSITNSLETLNDIIEKKEEEKHRLEINLAKQEAEKEGMLSRLNEEFQLTYAEAEKYKKDIKSIETLKSEISTLKGKISSLGTVNLGAIEEYEQTIEKYTFMSEQKEDLEKGKRELIDVINEMTNKMKEVFNENFEKLRENFNETFRELFKGGSADLILSDGDELDGNIDINVQPPGKKLQNINLMSGGEKGLSAIALLFAILKMKPTPFCILDEIEAALDDANVSRYAEFLKKFSEKIQFIVITHRKGTMEASDVLYGVTMEEKGVSKIVSVDLTKVSY